MININFGFKLDFQLIAIPVDFNHITTILFLKILEFCIESFWCRC